MALFSGLSEKLNHVFSKLANRGKLTQLEIKEAMRDVRVALLEADVNFMVAKDFIKKVTEKAVGDEVLQSLTPSQQVIKIVNEELIALMSSPNQKLQVSPKPPTVIMMCGLQGAGKTTMCAKLAAHLKKSGKRPLLVACDIYRPAAIEQLKVVGKQANAEVFEKGTQNPVKTSKQALEYASSKGFDTVIIDTAGRLHINEELMEELEKIKTETNPTEILLTVDSMTGQDAVNVAMAFHEKLNITGCLLTKLDSDTRGGAALSIRYLTQIPIKFIGVGEKMDEIEVFHPDRMAKRILGMGDVLSFIEKAQQNIDEEEAEKMAKKMQKGTFTYNDFLSQIKMIKKMGSLKGLLGMIPGIGSQIRNLDIDDKQFVFVEAIISSMTKEERNDPDLITKNQSRKNRIAKGSGRSYAEVNQLTKMFEQMRAQMKSMMNMDEADMEKMAKGQKPMPMPTMKAKKGRGKNKGRFRI